MIPSMPLCLQKYLEAISSSLIFCRRVQDAWLDRC